MSIHPKKRTIGEKTRSDDYTGLWGRGSVEGGRNPPPVHSKHPAARGRTGKQMGHREKHISVRSDIRRSLHPIRAAQEVLAD